MTTGSFIDDFRIAGLPGGSYGRRLEKSWDGIDRFPKQKPDPTPLREMYLTPAHLGLLDYVAPLDSTRRRDYNGNLIIPYTVPIVGPNSRQPKRARDEWHPYTLDRSFGNSGTYIQRNNAGVQTGGPFTMDAWENGDWSWRHILTGASPEYTKLLNSVWHQMKGSDFNLSIALAEGNQTLNMIGGNAIKLAKALHHLRRGDVAGAGRSLVAGTDRRPLRNLKSIEVPPGALRADSVKNLSNAWLELSYGWLPLLGDCYAGAQALAHRLTPPFRHSVKSRVVVSEQIESAVAGGSFATTSRSDTIWCEFIASENPSLPAVLGLTNPLSVAWEVVPFSFVVDWFLPIGDYLEARGAVSSLKGTYRFSRLAKSTTKWRLGVYPEFNFYNEWAEPNPFESVKTTCRFARSPETSAVRPPVPSFKPLDSALSWRHCLSAIALLAGAKPPVK